MTLPPPPPLDQPLPPATAAAPPGPGPAWLPWAMGVAVVVDVGLVLAVPWVAAGWALHAAGLDDGVDEGTNGIILLLEGAMAFPYLLLAGFALAIALVGLAVGAVGGLTVAGRRETWWSFVALVSRLPWWFTAVSTLVRARAMTQDDWGWAVITLTVEVVLVGVVGLVALVWAIVQRRSERRARTAVAG